MPVTIGGALRFCGSAVSPQQLALIRETVRDFPRLSYTELAGTLCELLAWRRPNGGLKTRECSVFLDELQHRGWLPSLPQRRPVIPRGRRPTDWNRRSDPQPICSGALCDYRPIRLELVRTAEDRQLFRHYLERYHYLGYRVPYGAQLRYFVHGAGQPSRVLVYLGDRRLRTEGGIQVWPLAVFLGAMAGDRLWP